MKVGIFGGTFNPPHLGHLKASVAAAEQLGLDRLIVVPAGMPPHKGLPDGSPSADMRLHMARAAFADTHGTVVLDIEAKQSEPSYTVNTVERIMRDYPRAELYLLVGTDMYLTLDTWKDSAKLMSMAIPSVFSRSAEDLGKISGYSSFLQETYGVHTETIENCVVDISSSQLREMLPGRKGAGYITDTTYSYIIKNRLYGAKPNWDWLREKAHSMLTPLRVPHVAGCEKEALRLAKRWNVDDDDAREAAILHDITKKLGIDENVLILENHGISVGKLEFAEEKLLHSKTGALLAKTMFGVSDEVFDAITWHTTGRAGMSALEKVIYLADYIEQERDFPGVEALRAAAYENIDDAMRMGLEMSIRDMTERGITPNKASFDALNDLRTSI